MRCRSRIGLVMLLALQAHHEAWGCFALFLSQVVGHSLVNRKEKEAQTSRADMSHEKLLMLMLSAVSLDAGAQAGPSGQPYSGGGFGAPQQGSFGAAPGGFGQPSPPAFGGSQF